MPSGDHRLSVSTGAGQLSSRVLGALSSRAGSRSKIQLDQIEEAMRLMNFGQELHEDTRRELCQMVERQTLPKGAILMEYSGKGKMVASIGRGGRLGDTSAAQGVHLSASLCIREVPALRSTVQQIVRPLKSAPGWLLDDEDLLDEQGISIAVAPPVSSRKGSPKGTANHSLKQTFSEMLRPQLFPAESAASTLSIPEEQAHTQPYAHEQLAMLHEEDEVAVSAPVRGTKLITSAERPGRDAPPPTPAANLYSPPGTGKAKQGQAPPPTPAYLDTTSASTNAVPQKSPRGKASKILSVKRRQCPINSVLHAQIPASTGSATLPIQQQLTPGTGGSTARRANSLFVEVAKLGRLDSFGEAAFVKSSPQPATAMAVLSTDVLIISKHQILKHGSPDLLQRLSKAAQLASMSGEMVSQAFITSAQWHEYKDQLVKQVAAEKQLERAVHPICAWEFFRKPFRSPMISGKLNTHPWQ
ncbi:hypothetical protein WJX84_011019 [Apatococcus fuscideae]|uniref:Cyclic nucleotide-binding domain-containing protein n=1 Tax=Apatococcus fuscideae TaxID=2026836 RepID=A0AAW1T921_9CHLO